MTESPFVVYSGRCLDCGRAHTLTESAESRLAVASLVRRLEALNVDPSPKVVGALVGRDSNGAAVELVAISGAIPTDVPIHFAPSLRDHEATAVAETETLRRLSELDAALAAVRAELQSLDGDTVRHAMAARASSRLAESARRRAERHASRAALHPSTPNDRERANPVQIDPHGDALRLIDDEARRERSRHRDEVRQDRDELERLVRAEDHLNATRLALLGERRLVSAALMAQIFDAYRLRSVGGRALTLPEALRVTGHDRAVPSGTGDCAAPRLLAGAGRARLKEVSLSEVWWAPGDTRHGRPVGPCAERCQPLLGFLLCPAPAAPDDDVA